MFLTSFFSILPIYGFQKNCKIFVLFYCMDPGFYKKKLRYLKSKISTKFHRLLFLFYFFSIFGIFFSISAIQTCPKIIKFFVVFIGRVRDFTSYFWKIPKVLFKKVLIIEIYFFSKLCGLLFVFLFFIFLTFYFQFHLSILVKKF